VKHRSLPPDVAASLRDLSKSLATAANIIESFAGLTEQLAAKAANEAEVRELATTGLLFVERARQLVQLTQETVGD
jgi:hypothetical protein